MTLWRLLIVPVVLLLASCAISPGGPTQLSFFPHSQMVQMGAAAYQKKRAKLPEADNPAVVGYVQCVARHVTGVLNGKREWRITVFKKDVANAWALPGGYIGVFTGLLEYTDNQAQLATVIGHEVSHVLAHHSNARMSMAYATSAGLQLIQVLLGQDGEQHQLAMAALGIGAQVGLLLPYTRAQEAEADIMGLMLMARAGFDPREAIDLWHNMSRAAGSAPPEFLSTHPSNYSRIKNLKAHMDKALRLYHNARDAGRHPHCVSPAHRDGGQRS